MSAYVVASHQLDAILRFVCDNPNSLMNTPFYYNSANSLGQILRRENQRSVAYRYLHNAAIVKETRALPRYQFCDPVDAPSTRDVIAALMEYDYNACECPDYAATPANTICSAILAYAQATENT